jgi:tRNA A37 threonylcarbamoyladenosine dehydratase
VGSHAALTIAIMGMARHIKLADPDEISASNLNRLNYDFTKIGKNKAQVAAEFIYQVNPYAEIDIYSNGINY